MSTSNNNLTYGNKIVYDDGIAIPYISRFWLLLVSNILSLICCIFVLFHLLFDATLRRGLQNHVMIVLLFMCIIWELTDVPWTMHVYLFNVVWIQTPTFCMIWKFIDSAIYTTIAKLVAWASVERHILIFHDQWVSTQKKRILAHYTPIIFILIYGIVLYGVITPMNDCNRPFYYFISMCAYYSCIYDSSAFGLYEFSTGGLLCSILIGFGSVSLILRVVYQKRRLQRHIQWRKHRKMTIQLLSIVSLFYILYLPPVILGTARRLGVPSYVGADYSTYASFFAFYIVFLLPFASLNTLPNFRTRIKQNLRYFYRRPARAVAPEQSRHRTLINHPTIKRKTTAV